MEGCDTRAVWDSHVEDKERDRHFKNVDKVLSSESDSKLRVLTMDLQQLLMCLKSFSSATLQKKTISSQFYHFWPEHLRSLPNTVEPVILWSDDWNAHLSLLKPNTRVNV